LIIEIVSDILFSVDVMIDFLFFFQTTSCFRSTGSVPIPRPAQLHFNSVPIRKKKKVDTKPLAEPTIRKVEVSSVEIGEEETTIPIPETDIQYLSAEIADIQGLESIDRIFQPMVLLSEPTETVADTVPELPPKKAAENPQSCRKHSRCHCHLFSKETEGFFSVPTAPTNK